MLNDKLADVLSSLIAHGVCEDLKESWYYVDEPLHYQFYTRIYVGTALEQIITGTAFTPETAHRKTIFEAVERFCVSASLPTRLSSASEVSRFFPLARAPILTDVLPHQVIRAIECDQLVGSAKSHDTVPVPVQLVTVPYTIPSDEPILREPISTGTACGDTREDAILRGLLECIERDAVMLSFYGRQCVAQVDITADSELWPIVDELARCRLRLIVADVSSTDFCVKSFLVLLIDETEFGPALTAGAKAGVDPVAAIRGAIEEAVHIRAWLRDHLADRDGHFEQTETNEPATVHSFLDRARLWSRRSMLSHIDFYSTAPRRLLEEYTVTEAHRLPVLDDLKKDLLAMGASAFVADLSSRFTWATDLSLYVVKVMVPTLQPLFIDESYRILTGERFQQFRQLYDSPTHFFL
ncbi:MAG: ribosomal protein methylthiotransferase accessory factor [Blastocatellia bacterium]|jgi:thiazole/oxazole-forming peptide maturase SagD family component|nr:ribosomal protein methylthiotransferase accessory factor [Blastocatellia bacterium]